ncbi:hypothetical protein B0H17DRAFT_1093813 [Mycena rosella]|uniref:Pheromone n=1 Tax=Mycena rosella TaxID=1033263 RepID=A0AAD7G710_MYCRO|nr:hypothetical protein B0H17DRAFT_1093813 [Mycena rosella]
MDSFTSLESLLSATETPVVFQSAVMSPSYEPSSEGVPIDEEHSGAGTSVAFCVIA